VIVGKHSDDSSGLLTDWIYKLSIKLIRCFGIINSVELISC